MEHTTNSERQKALVYLFLVTMIWGATFIWMKQALVALSRPLSTHGTSPIVASVVALRFLIALILLIIVFFVRKKPTISRDEWVMGSLLGGVMFAGFFIQMFALREINPSTSAFLTSLYVVFTACILSILTRKSPSKYMMTGVVCATVGAGFIQGPPHLTWGLGEVFTVVCAMFFAVHIVMTQRLTQHFDPMNITLTSFTTLTLCAAIVYAWTSKLQLAPLSATMTTTGVLIPVLCLGIGGSFISLLVLNYFQRSVDPLHAAIIYTFEPVWATLFGLWLMMVEWTNWVLVGGFILLAGNILVERTQHSLITE